jgi:hypothetical protein
VRQTLHVSVKHRQVGVAGELCPVVEPQRGCLQRLSIANGLAENVITMIGLCEDPHGMRERHQYDHPHGTQETLEIREIRVSVRTPEVILRLREWSLAGCRPVQGWPTNTAEMAHQSTLHML